GVSKGFPLWHGDVFGGALHPPVYIGNVPVFSNPKGWWIQKQDKSRSLAGQKQVITGHKNGK
ncbi:hypothetical protein, partial [Pseudomonas cannabina]|uniref:hypothetical protein n=1 Tax=Pseudomonas cannabina TaxID=86840 RepID=UPI001EE45D13